MIGKHTLTLRQAQSLSGQLRSWAYNAIDCIATREVADVLLSRLDSAQARFYAFERAAQLPAFAMTRRGMLVDEIACGKAITALRVELRACIKSLNSSSEVLVCWDQMALVTGKCRKSTRKDGRHTWEKGVPDSPMRHCVSCRTSRMVVAPFNPISHHQCAHLLYELMSLPAQFNKKKERSTEDDCLQRLGRKYKRAHVLCEAILHARGLKKQIGFLKFRRTADGRFVSSFVVGQAWTGRWSSTQNPHKEGGNAQNIAERHRHIFVADPGMELCYIDLKQAESNIVAHLAGDEDYIKAHQTGDVHTYVTRLIWSDLGWTWDLEQDKAIAKQSPSWDQAPGHNFRFQAKRIQHGGNYGLTPFGIARIAHIPQAAATQAAGAYHNAFPGIREWQRSVGKTVRFRGPLFFPLGFSVKLFGRPWDDHTIKQGLSLIPQGTVAHIINIAVWRLWTEMDPHEIQMLAQVHDAALFQFPKGRLDIVEKAMKLMQIPLDVFDIHGKVRTTTIEVEAAVGANWGHASDDNPHGLREVTF